MECDLATTWGSRSSLISGLSAMPPIRPTPVAALREVADTWQANHPDVSPAGITRKVRLASAQARAAWFVHQLAHGELHPFQGSCERCGTLTSSWCEGCYARCGLSPLTFSSLCQVCDVERRVCRLCEEVQIDYNLGHEAYRCQQQQGATDTLEVEIKGGQ